MNKVLLFSALAAASGLCAAQDMGRVLSSTPVIQQVSVPRQVCTTEQVAVQQPKSGAGAALGAIAGGAIGNAVGRGGGNAVATVVGVIGGAMVGDRIESAPEPELRDVQRCGTQNFYENRTVAYNVVYEYAGKQYSVQMPNDPGPTIPIQISPAGSSPQASSGPVTYPAAPAYVQQPTYVQPAPVVITQPAYPVYYVRPYYPPPYYPAVRIDLGYGRWGYAGHHHWR